MADGASWAICSLSSRERESTPPNIREQQDHVSNSTIPVVQLIALCIVRQSPGATLLLLLCSYLSAMY